MNSFCKLADVYELWDVAISCLQATLPQGFVINYMKVSKPFIPIWLLATPSPIYFVDLHNCCQEARPKWRHRIEQWEKSQATMIESSYKCTEPYARLYPVYVIDLCPKVIAMIEKHRLKRYTLSMSMSFDLRLFLRLRKIF